MKKNSTKPYDIALTAIVFFIVGYVVCGAYFFNHNYSEVNIEERQNEILAMDAADVVITYIPELLPKLEQLSNETADELVRAIIRELRSTFEEISKESYIRGYTDGGQRISGNLPATN